MNTFSSRQSGSALLIVLSILAILTLIILTVMSMALFDSRLSSNNLAQTQAVNMAKYAIDDVSDKLSQIPLDRHWASGPGRIRYWDGVSNWTNIELYSGTNATSPASPADYSDGSTAATAAKCVQLNVPLPDGSYTIMSTNSAFPTAPDMTVKWIYILQDGTVQTDSTKLPNAGVVGRYGYWTDVENGRVNINTAGFGMVNGPPNPGSTTNPSGRFQWNVENWAGVFGNPTAPNVSGYIANVLTPNPWMSDRATTSSSGVTFPALDRPTAQLNTIQNLTAHPSSIDLSFLDNVSVLQSFNTFRYAGSYFLRVDARNSYSKYNGTDVVVNPTPNPDLSVRFFNDPSDWMLIVDAATYQRNKGYITVKGRSPEITPWGLPKMALSMTAQDGHALNDLTEWYSRNVALASGAIGPEDSRMTQVPSVIAPPLAVGVSSSPYAATPPYGLRPERLSFRNLSYCYQVNNNYLAVGTLINNLKNVLITNMPGFSTSVGAKYNASDNSGTNGGEAEQIAVELMSFVDGCINPSWPGYAPFNTMTANDNLSPYGLQTVPMAGTPAALMTTNPSLTRREGTTGQFLINEIALQASSVSYASQTGLAPVSQIATFTSLPKAFASSTSTLVFLVGQPTNTSTDKFIQINPWVETITPPHFGFAPPLTYNLVSNLPSNNPEEDIGNTEIDYSTDGINFTAINYDICGAWKPIANSGTLQADNPYDPGPTFSYQYNLGLCPAGRPFSTWPYPSVTANGDSYASMNTFARYILVGPFPAGTTVWLKVKPRFLFEFLASQGKATVMHEIIPGIFADYPSGNPSDASYVANQSAGKPDPTDPNSTNITSNFLEFDVPPINVNTSSAVSFWISKEATDPRVTRRNTDWTTCAAAAGNTLGAANSTILSPNPVPDDSNVARPPSFLQTIRGPMRTMALGSPESQNASRILGLPGMGYLSEVPTGVDSGIPWADLKFFSNTDNPPDWLLWNLFYVPFDRSMLNQTDGKLNINAKLYPFTDSSGNVLVREKPLEALLGNRVTNPATLATAIANGPPAISGASLPTDLYVYAGQICQVPGFADSSVASNRYDEERLSRDLADIVTTQSSDFRVFVVAQTLKQSSTGQITSVATQRVEATLSRIVDPGKQGYPFAMYDNGPTSTSVPYPFNVYLRSAYRPSAGGPPVPSATRVDVEGKAIGPDFGNTYGLSPLGADDIPNTADDWLIPQKIEISSYKLIK